MGWLRRFVRPSSQARNWTDWSAPAILLLRLPPDPTSATALRALDPNWHRRPQSRRSEQRTDGAPSVSQETTCPIVPLRPPATAVPQSTSKTSTSRPQVARRRPGRRGRLHPAGRQIEHRRPYGDRFGPLDAPGRVDGDQAGRADQGALSAASPRIEGLPAADWVLIDADDVIVHLFRPEVRSFYNLERMWAFGDEPNLGAASQRG